jgi:phosphatidylglycerol lysyltransferase
MSALQIHPPSKPLLKPTRAFWASKQVLSPLEKLTPDTPIATLKTWAEQCTDPRASLLLQQDKYACGDAHGNFLMFAKTLNYQIGLRGVMGKAGARIELQSLLLMRFLQQGKKSLRYSVFYQADSTLLAQIQALGFNYDAYKLGEEAILDLAHFSLQGAAFANLRQNIRKAIASGLHFELCPSATAETVAQCHAISDQWLQTRKAKEKCFSIARFKADALIGSKLAMIYQGDRLVAFASIETAADQSLLSVDLMRHTNDSPRGTMDLLFARLIEWGQTQGFQEFSLGMSPLKDIQADAIAHDGHWVQFADAIAKHGERFYNFKGVRTFKEKWQPEWRPRYLLVPSRRHALPALLACAVEIAGGHRGLLGFNRNPSSKS